MDDPTDASAYEKADFSAVNGAFVERLRELVRPLSRGTALDLGTGPGDIPLRFVAAERVWTVVAVDASFPMLTFAARAAQRLGYPNRLPLVMADAKRLPFPDSQFDGILSNSILHHVADPVALWRETRRVARPGAWVFFRDLFRPATDAAARAIVSQYAAMESTLLQQEFYQSLLAAYRPDEVAAQLAQAGLCGLAVTVTSDRHLDVAGIVEK